MTRLTLMWCLASLAIVHISAQDPTKTLPDSYKVQFENDRVRVVRVHYAAGAKLPDHAHPPGTTVYVYLNDSEGVIFAHSGNINRSVTRPAVKAGSVRVASGPEEHHTAENPASTPSDFLRIQIKGDTASRRTVTRLLRGEYRAGENATDQQLENQQLRVTRLIVVAAKPMTLTTRPEPSLLITVPSGDTRWLDANAPVTLTSPGEFLRLDFLTPPKPQL